MKIAEMNNCIEKMREIYKFDDEKTKIIFGSTGSMTEHMVIVNTKDENGTEIRLSRRIDEFAEKE